MAASHAICLILLAFAAVEWTRRAGKEGQGPLHRLGVGSLAVALGVVSYRPATYELLAGQTDIAIALLLASTLWLAARGRRKWAGTTLALAILCKAQPILLLPAMAVALGWNGVATVIAN